MSSMSANVTPVMKQENGKAGHGEKEEKPKRVRPYKPRLATKVKWALGDGMQRLLAAEQKMERVRKWLEKTYAFDIDDRTRAHLGELEHELFGLALDVSKAKELVSGAIMESKPETKHS